MSNMMNEPPTDSQLRFIKTIKEQNSNAPEFTGATKADACDYIGKYKSQSPAKLKVQQHKDTDAQWIKDPERFMTFLCSNCGNPATKGDKQIYCDMCGKRMRTWSTK